MPEAWEDELAKVDRLAPSEGLRDKIGHVPTPDQRERPGRRVRTIAVAATISLAAGLFAWRALGPLDNTATPPRPPASAQLPDEVDVVCSTSGTQVSTPTVVSPDGVHFAVSNPGNFDEVVIEGTGGEGALSGADIDLSSSLEHTFNELPPGTYVLGCYSDSNVPSGIHDTIATAPGMEPFEILDPDQRWVSPTLECDGGGMSDEFGVIVQRDGVTAEESVRSALGLNADYYTVEPSRYVALWKGFDSPGSLRIVSDGRVIGELRVLGVHELNGKQVIRGDLKACQESGLRFSTPNP